MKSFSLIRTVLVALAMFASQQVLAISGTGTSSSPYKISSASDMATLRTKVADAAKGTMIYAELTSDITSLGSWTPIGTSSKPFNGVFNGGGHAISGMSISSYTTTYQGLFGYVNNATIKDFTLGGTMTSSTKLTSTDDASGTVVGRATGASTISGITSKVSITIDGVQQKHLGGIVGTLEGTSSVAKCTYTGTLDAGTSTDCIGGIVGFAVSACSGSIQDCLFTGKLKTTGSGPTMGGILGYTNDESSNFGGVKYCLSVGTFTYSGSSTYVNGIVGRIRNRATSTVYNYYLSTTASKACNTDGPTIPKTNTSATQDVLKGGETTWLLNGSSTSKTTWRQTLDSDNYPMLDQTHKVVYKVSNKTCDGTSLDSLYKNTNANITTHSLGYYNATSATCTSTGTIAHYVCALCKGNFDADGNKLSSIVVAKKAHSFPDGDRSKCSVCQHGFIYYTSTDGKVAESTIDNSLKVWIVSNTYSNGEGVIELYDEKSSLPTSLPGQSFYNSKNLKTMTLPTFITGIGVQAFAGCTALTDISTVLKHITSIGNYAFDGCTSLTGNLTLANTVTKVGVGAFRNCTGFKGKLTLSSGLTQLEQDAFNGCSGFTGTLTIPSSVTTIYAQAFKGCKSLSGNLVIPSSVTTLNESAFEGCSGFNGQLKLQTTSLSSIRDGVFKGCSGLTGDLVLPSGLKYIYNNVFEGCTGLNGTVQFPTGFLYIGQYAFKGCTGLKGDLTLPESLSNLLEGAFSGCTSYKGTLTLEGTAPINESAFANCPFSAVKVPRSSLSLLNTNAFSSTTLAGTLYVPSTAYKTFNTDSNWKQFATIHCISHPSIDKVDAQAATCLATGCKEHYECSLCHAYYSDSKGTNELAKADVVLPITSHNILHMEKQPATCTAVGYQPHYECTMCHVFYSDSKGSSTVDKSNYTIAKIAHDYQDIVVESLRTSTKLDATNCLRTSKYDKSCSVCGARSLNTGDTFVRYTLEHTMQEGVCSRCHFDSHLDMLCLTSGQKGSTVMLHKLLSPDEVKLQYSTNRQDWYYLETEQPLTLDEGQQVFYAAVGANSIFNKAYGQYQFVMTGSFDASGNVMSLLDATCQQTTVPYWGLGCLFKDCTVLHSAPLLPATTLNDHCYESMFQGCTSLTCAPLLPAPTLATDSYKYMFQGCTSLNEVNVDFTQWSYNTGYWLTDVAATGTFYCPQGSGKPSRNDYGVPAGWTIKYVVLGDVNKSDAISVTDITSLIDALKQNKAATLDKKAADVDGDGQVTLQDIEALKDKVMGK